jgi:ATP-dependent DNA ligase
MNIVFSKTEVIECPECGGDLRESFSPALFYTCDDCGLEFTTTDDYKLSREQMLLFRPMKSGTFKEERDLSKLSDEGFIQELKLNGDRIEGFTWRAGTQLFTRTLDRADKLPVEKTGCAPHIEGVSTIDPHMWDGEIVTRGNSSHSTVATVFGCSPAKCRHRQKEFGKVVATIFDCIVEDGNDIREEPLSYRLGARDYLIKLLQKRQLEEGYRKSLSPKTIIATPSGHGEDYRQQVLGAKMEGVIVKDLSKPYVSDKRPSGTWLKIKEEVELDLVIIGFKDAKETSTKSDGTVSATKFAGLVGSVALGAYDEATKKMVHLCYASGIGDVIRKKITKDKIWYTGKVVRVVAQKVTMNKKGGISLQNPRIGDDSVRDDKLSVECLFEDVKIMV